MQNTSEIANRRDIECLTCGESGAWWAHQAPEIMFGTGEEFDYLECSDCGSLQIDSIPHDLAAHYPDDYYSFEPTALQSMKDRAVVGLGWLRAPIAPLVGRSRDLAWMEFAGVSVDSRVVDVGCGSGRLLHRLERSGYRNLCGVDPFIEADRQLPGGTPIRKAQLGELDGAFDLIMFNHSFEHTVEPIATLDAAGQRLAPGGRLLLRVPVVAEAWTRFGVHWVQLDPPRHLHLQSMRGMSRLAERVGMRVIAAKFDSTAFQFWGSIQAQRGVAMTSPKSYGRTRHRLRPAFSRRQILRFRAEAKRLNRSSSGDQAGFLLEMCQ